MEQLHGIVVETDDILIAVHGADHDPFLRLLLRALRGGGGRCRFLLRSGIAQVLVGYPLAGGEEEKSGGKADRGRLKQFQQNPSICELSICL